MSYTLAYTGTQIDNILGRSAPNGEFDGYFADINDKLDKLNIVTTSDDYATVQAYVQNNVAVALSDGGGLYAYAGEYDGNYYFAKLTQGSSDTTDAVFEVAYIDSGNNWSVGGWSALAPVFSPNFTGNPTAPTPIQSSNNTKIATTAFVHTAVDPVSSAALNAYPTDFVSGDIVSFTDGADGIPVKAFTGSIIPQQNLHGQSAPYPAGGGKNLLPMTLASIKSLNTSGTWNGNAYTIAGITYTVGVDSGGNVTGITASGTATGTAAIRVSGGFTLAAGSYTLNGCPSGGDWSTKYGVNVRYESTTHADKGTGYNISASYAISVEYSEILIRSGYAASNLQFKPMVRLATESDTFAPYSNICPISGWTGANIYRTGVNVWDEEWEVGAYNGSTGAKVTASGRIRSKNKIPVTPSATYFFKGPSNFQVYEYGSDESYIKYTGIEADTTLTLGATTHFITFNMGANSGETYGHNIAVNYPSTVTTYQPYNGSTIVLTFGQTVYAGTLTALGGGLWKIQPTHAALTLNGSESWAAYASGNGYRMTVSGMSSGEAQTGWTDWLATVTNLNSLGVEFGRNDARIYAAQANTIPSVTDLASWQTYLGTHNLNILYPLATLPDPIIVSAEDLQTLLGANTVWTDVGSVTGMTYRADTALYIDKKLGV